MEPEQQDYRCSKKKIKQTVREPTGSTFMLRCAELGLSDEALEDMTCGMVYDLMIEKANDAEQYAIRGRPGGLRDFFAGGGKIG